MRAVKVRAPNDIFVDPAAPLPTLRPDYLLIKVFSVALNPTDWKGASVFKQETPHTVGCDVAGRVIECGEQVTKKYEIGDRVTGLCYSIRIGDPTSGAYGEYALLKGALSLPLPAHVSDAEAATIPVGINTIGQALYQTLNLELPALHGAVKSVGPTILIYGGATSTGMFAVQFARLSGCQVLTTCSPCNFQLVKALGAHEVFDYHDAEACSAAIRDATDDSLLYVFDCVAEGTSLKICADALTSQSGVAKYTATLPVAGKFPRQDVRHGWTSGYSAFGETYYFMGKPQPPKPADLAFATRFWDLTAQLLRQDRLRLGPLVRLREDGLDGVVHGLSELKAGLVSAGKLVYMI